MEAELTSGTQATPGVATTDHGITAPSGRETVKTFSVQPSPLQPDTLGVGGTAS